MITDDVEECKNEYREEVAMLQSPSDEALISVLGTKNFNELNEKILEGVLRTYKNEMTQYCGLLIDNDGILGRAKTRKETKKDAKDEVKFEIKDPNTLTNAELKEETVLLEKALAKLKEDNEKGRNSLYLLKLSQEGLDLDIGFRSVELIMANDTTESEENME